MTHEDKVKEIMARINRKSMEFVAEASHMNPEGTPEQAAAYAIARLPKDDPDMLVLREALLRQYIAGVVGPAIRRVIAGGQVVCVLDGDEIRYVAREHATADEIKQHEAIMLLAPGTAGRP